MDADEVKTRQEYLRTQRDKIVALKRKVRTDQLNANAERSGRPTSAQAARLLLSDAKLSDAPMEASLQLRKTLAKRLRNEVVDSKEWAFNLSITFSHHFISKMLSTLEAFSQINETKKK